MHNLFANFTEREMQWIALALGIVFIFLCHWRIKRFSRAFLISTFLSPILALLFMVVFYSSLYLWLVLGLAYAFLVSALISGIVGGIFVFFRKRQITKKT